MEKRNRVETILNSIATATPVPDPRDRLELIASAIAAAFGGSEVGTIKTRDRFELLLLEIAKAISDSGVVIIQSLSVTENGTYTASEGTAYSPVTVNVPLPDNALLLESATAGATVIITDGADAPLDSLKCGVTAVQSGTGSPSPENIRAISGWESAVVHVNDNTVTISFGSDRVVYGGTFDVTTGLLTITDVMVSMGDLTWTKYNDQTMELSFFTTTDLVDSILHDYTNIIGMCEQYEWVSWNNRGLDKISINAQAHMRVYPSDYQTATGAEFKTAMDGVKLVYKLATPLTVQLNPTQIRTESGSNTIYVNCGNITECKYFATGV